MNYEFDLMISYCWAEKTVCKQIFQRLNTKGYRIWFDEQNMHGNSLSAMAAAIENSQYIVICMSENYEKSNACHHEAEYAYVRQRQIVPLIVQSKYKPKQWLGFIIGATIYVDFTKYKFDQAFGMLEEEMKTTKKTIEQKSVVPVADSKQNKTEPKKQDDTSKNSLNDVVEKKVESKQQISIMHENKPVKKWTSEDVISWCHIHKLLTFVQLLEHCDGASLLRLHTMTTSKDDIDVFRLLQEDCQRLGNSAQIKLTLTEFVRFQTELDKRLKQDTSQSETMPATSTKSGTVCALL